MDQQNKNDIPMKIHSNHQFKEMLDNGTARVIQNKYTPYTNITTYVIGDLNPGLKFPRSVVNGTVSGVINNFKYNIDFETTAESESSYVSTEILVTELPTEAAPAAPPAELAPDIEQTNAFAELPQENEPIITAKAPQINAPIATVLPAALDTGDVAVEPPVSVVPVTAVPDLLMLSEPISAVPEIRAITETVTATPEPPGVVEAFTAAPPVAAVVDPQVAVVSSPPAIAVPLTTVTAVPAVSAQDSESLKIPRGFDNINTAESIGYEMIPTPLADENTTPPPYISFITFNRLGLTTRNLANLLDSNEDFELNIIDCNSKDNSWDYIQSLTDKRIKSKIRFNKNYGPIYAVNYALSRRKPNQYFIAMDSDTFIITKNWIARFMEVFEAFPDVGLLGLMRDNPYPRYLPPIIPRLSGDIAYLELKNANIEAQMDFVPGQLQCLSPKLINEVGYWSEENGFGDAELSPRVVHYTDLKAGFVTTIDIDMTQKISCNECTGKNFCMLARSINDCFSLSKKYNKNESFVDKNTWKFKQTFDELKMGQRTAYCASIHDPESMRTHLYNADWANDNFNHYLLNSNE